MRRLNGQAFRRGRWRMLALSRTWSCRSKAMMKPTLVALFSVLCSLLSLAQEPARSAGQANAASQPAGGLRQIIPGHYVYASATYNSGIIGTSEGVVVLDALN